MMLRIFSTLLLLLCAKVAYVSANKESNIFSLFDKDSNKTIETVAHLPHFDNNDWKEKRPTFDSNMPAMDLRKHAHAQLGEDRYLYSKLFYGMKNGIILESGALNGVTYSTTWLFEHMLGWQSIHVEADPVNYKDLIVQRPKGINIHTALCSEPHIIHWTLDLVGGATNGIWEFMPQRLKDVLHPKLKNAPMSSPLFLPLPCLPLKLILEKLGVTHIDIWVLDVEGGGLSVLLGTDLQAVQVDVILIECDGWNGEQDKQKMELLKKHHYSCAKLDRANFLCQHPKFKPSVAPGSAILG